VASGLTALKYPLRQLIESSLLQYDFLWVSNRREQDAEDEFYVEGVSHDGRQPRLFNVPDGRLLFHDRIYVSTVATNYFNVLTEGRVSDIVCFSAVFVWAGFQTGNSAQVGLTWTSTQIN
jgi:hypothetical protein